VNLVLLHNPMHIARQTNLFDGAMVVMFLSAVGYAIVQWRRGTRIYATLIVAAFLYGLVLELGGMATLNIYTQGDFILMLNFRALKPFQNTTAMPSYVLIFYPVFLFGLTLFPLLRRRRDMAIHVSGFVLASPFRGAIVGADQSPRPHERQSAQ
jgi:hypothetical protein